MPILQKKPTGISIEERYQHLLCQSLRPHEAEYIVWLEFKTERSNEENRLLDLMYDSTTRRCAEVIVFLESHNDSANSILAFLLNTHISEDVRFFIANQCRKAALAKNKYISWLHAKPTIELLWYPEEYNDIDLHVTYLEHKTAQTPHEEQLLQLLRDENTRSYAFPMMVLSSVMSHSLSEEIYFKLLLDANTRCYAKRMTYLACKIRTIKEEREFKLLRDPALRAYAAEIISIEFKEAPSPEDLRYLRLLFDPMSRSHAKLIMEKDDLAYEDLPPEECDILMDYYLYAISPSEAFGDRIQSAHVSLSILAPRCQMSSLTLLSPSDKSMNEYDNKKSIIRYVVNHSCDELLENYLKIKHVNNLIKEKGIDPAKSASLISYKERNKRLLSFYIIKYFYRTRQIFSEQELTKVVSAMKEKISSSSETKKCLGILMKEVIDQCEILELLDTSPRLSPNRNKSIAPFAFSVNGR